MLRLRSARFVRALAVMPTVISLASCQFARDPADAPIPPEVAADIVAIGSTPLSPIYIRIFKEEAEFEVWKRRMDGTYALLETYPICAWSGSLGPKLAEGDRQAPEGFYTVTPAQLNPNSDYHLSFDIGFPNAYDTALGRTGSHLMVHGACSSAGCYSMTDDVVEVIYALVREAFLGGQRSFEVHAFPFRMTPENMARHWGSPNLPFWVMLKEGYDHFEVTRQVPEVAVCDNRYIFNANADGAAFIPGESCPAYRVAPEIVMPLMAKQEADDLRFRTALAELYTEAAVVAAAAQGYGPLTLIPEAYRPVAIDATVTAAIGTAY